MIDKPVRKHSLAECESCPLKDAHFAPTSGPENAKIAFVSRSPGKHDIRAGKPFGGPSGKVLDHLLNKYGVDRKDIITTNTVLCETDDPPNEAIKACKNRLETEVQGCDLILAGGTEATIALTKYRAVYRARGFSITRTSISGKRQRVVVTNNPALVLRKSDAYPDLVADFKRAFIPPPPPKYPQVEIIENGTQGYNILRRWNVLQFTHAIAADLEWRSTTNEIVCAGFAARAEKSVVFGLGAISDERCRSELRKFLGRRDVRFIWHNGKADTKVLTLSGIEGSVDEDTFLMSFALDERPGYHKLEYLLSSEFGWPDYEPQSVRDFKRTGEFAGRKGELELYQYNGYDTAGTFQLREVLQPRMDEDGVVSLYERLLYASKRIRTVELNGFNFDVEEAANLDERVALPKLWELEAKLREICGAGLLNPRSTQQMQAIYYSQYGVKHNLRDMGKKKLSASTGKEVRTEIAGGRFTCFLGKQKTVQQFAATHARFAKVTKIRSNYIVSLILRAFKDGRIYCNFNLGGTVTGRSSSSEPNLQNIIREGFEDIPGIRTLFLPSTGNVIVAADYSQAELRTCAKLSGDRKLLEIYRDSSRSLHKERAAAFYGPDYSKLEYVTSKNINFGVTYGQSAEAFAQMYHMPKKEAQDYIDSWWEEFPTLKEWTLDVWKEARKNGFTQSPFGHKRRIHLITDENVGDLKRECVNFLPQNIAAWLTITSLCDLVDSGVRVIATVHDSIVADVPYQEVSRVSKLMKEIMEGQAKKQLGWTDIPFTADISIGPNWGEVTEVNTDTIDDVLGSISVAVAA